MALQSSGQISIDDLRTEFGVSGQAGLSDFYRGGGNVPDLAANSAIPTSGQIQLSDFYGASSTMDLNVEHGTTSINSGNANSGTITLTTPVPQGKAFVVHTVRSNTARVNRTACQATLQTPSGGNWTELIFERNGAPTDTVDIEYQVIYSEDIDVQQIDVNTASTAQLDVTITSVDTSKSFALFSCQAGSDGNRARTSVKFTSSTNVQLETFSSYDKVGTLYVVTSGIFNVTHHDYSFLGSSTDVTVTSSDPTTTIILNQHRTEDFGQDATSGAVSSELTTSTNVHLQRNDSDDGIYGTLQLINIDTVDMTIGGGTMASADGLDTISGTWDDVKTCYIDWQWGNNESSATAGHAAYIAHSITDNTLTLERDNTSDSVDYFYNIISIG